MTSKPPLKPTGKSVLARADGRMPLISQTAEYALRALALIAALPEGRSLTAIEVADYATVPVHYLSKVLRRLVAAGLLSSQKGHGGGFCLARPAPEIRFADVLAAVGEPLVIGRCAFGYAVCNADNPCPLHPAWKLLNESFERWAATTTLADISGERARELAGFGHGRTERALDG
jgi:Rrf2 family protein